MSKAATTPRECAASDRTLAVAPEADAKETGQSGESNPRGWSLSLCICTMNRPSELENCLASVFGNTDRPDEVIVSDDSGDDRPIREIVSKFPDVLYQRGPRQGLAANRNACIRHASGDYISFIDDDVQVPPGFFEKAQWLVRTGNQRTIFTGYEMNHLNGKQKVVPHNADFWGLQRLPVEDICRAVVINSSIFPRQLFQTIGFDNNLRYGSEEIDIARHAISLGYQIEYCDQLYVNHYPSPINRGEYDKWVEASRLYATTKAYWKYERSRVKAITFFFLGPLQLAGSVVRRQKGVRELGNAIRATLLAWRYLLKASRSNRQIVK